MSAAVIASKGCVTILRTISREMAAPVQVGDVYLCNTTQTIQLPTNAAGNRQEPIVIGAGSHIEIVSIVERSAFIRDPAGYNAIMFATEPRVVFYIPYAVFH